ncbi:hypothetical protein B0H13DRAFT_1889850 [Mycena leptocephala]|nr:hypothetical protein B0H13DRAFT_1889850 [Mycena leptocephala]
MTAGKSGTQIAVSRFHNIGLKIEPSEKGELSGMESMRCEMYAFISEHEKPLESWDFLVHLDCPNGGDICAGRTHRSRELVRKELNTDDTEEERGMDIWGNTTAEVAFLEDRPIQASSPEEMLEVVLSGVSKQSLEKSPLGGSEGIEKAVVNQYWDFGSKLAAVIILYQPQSFYLYPKSVIENFKKLPQLKNKAIVTEVVKCQAHAFCFSEESVVAGKLALKLVPSEHADTDGKPNYKWLTDMSAGLECYATTAASPFCALYSLKEIETNRFMPFR